MRGKKSSNEIEILKAFEECTRTEVFDRNLSNIHNPIYVTLSKIVKIAKHEIRKIILEYQPSVTLQKLRNDELPESVQIKPDSQQ